MSDRMEQGSWRNLAGGVLTLCLSPDGMRRRSRAARQLWDRIRCTARVDQGLWPLGSEMTCSVQENTQAGGDQDTDEAQGQPTYEYSGLESGNQVAAEYVQMLGGQL